MNNEKPGNKPSCILMGSKPGATVALSILIQRGWEVRYVVISEAIKHPWISGQSVDELAGENGIKVITQKQLPLDESVDFVISYMYRHLVKTDVIALANRAALNFHPGPLPEFGGWAFYNMAILENADEYGCTCHYMDENFDTGPVLKVRKFPINATMETAYSLEKKTQQEMILLFIEFCEIAETNKELPYAPQDKNKWRYLTKSEFDRLKEIPLNADEETADRYARAFWYPPYECAYIIKGSKKLEIVPKLAKNELARLLHQDDLSDLHKIAALTKKS